MAVPPQDGGVLMRTASAESVSLRHPVPGLESLQYLKNVERLEQSAEELSQGGSDIGDEIRKMKHEHDRVSRRSSSIASQASRASHASHASHASYASRASRESQSQHSQHSQHSRQHTDPSTLHSTTRSRNHSTSSYANSIVDVNGAARWGGYSPGGYVTSPTVSRVSSFRRPSGMPEPVQEGRPLDSPLASPTSYHSPVRQPSHYSLAVTNEEMGDNENEEEEEANDRHARADADKTPEPEHHEWDRTSGHMDPDEQSFYSQDDRQGGHYAESHYSQHQDDVQSGFQEQDQYRQDGFQEQDQNHAAYRQDGFQEQDQHRQDGFQEQHQDHAAYLQGAFADNFDLSAAPDRPQSADTYRQARSLFKDFDGVHFQELDQEQQQEIITRHISQTRVARQPRSMSYAHPPPGDGMVYYPAPVPRMLNLPKRLSQLPSASVQAKRRSEVLKTMPAQARQSAPWLPALDFGHEGQGQILESDEYDDHQHADSSLAVPSPQNGRRSMMDPQTSRYSTVPSQLRASVFFDTTGSPQTEVRIQSASAVATLDSILAASVNAPVNVFVDHPFAGPVTKDVYAAEEPDKRRSATIDLATAQTQLKKEHGRTDSNETIGARPAMTKRNSVMSLFTDMRNMGGDKDGKKLKKRASKMSLMTDLDMNDEPQQPRPESQHMTVEDTEHTAEGAEEVEDEDLVDDDDHVVPQEDMSEQDMNMPFFAQPTTLLAELQTRKAHQKTRNRTAANAFPNGMHSTLLQLDAVAQVEKNKRQKQRTRLAWEDPGLIADDDDREEVDEDVPLGVLFPTKHGLVNRGNPAGLSDWDRPLGLMEKREMEDNEPLISRRLRLKGVPPAEIARILAEQERQRREASLPPPEAVPLPGEEEGKEDDGADEPLALRLRRLKQKEALNSALGDVAATEKDGKSAFADELLSTLGSTLGIESKTKSPPPEPEEETLGQRRARLQREREAKAKASTSSPNLSNPASVRTVRPPLKSSPSLANLLAAHPITSTSNNLHGIHNPATGSLLAENARLEEDARRKMKERNQVRNSAYNRLNGSNSMPHNLQTSRSMQQLPQFPQLQQQQQPPILYPAHMIAGGGGFQPQFQQGYGYPQQQQQQLQNPYIQQFQQAYPGMGMQQMGGYGMQQQQQTAQQQIPPQQQQAFAHFAQMQANGATLQELNMDVRQRDLIDRWRASIAQ